MIGEVINSLKLIAVLGMESDVEAIGVSLFGIVMFWLNWI